jgi:hypothetical protein
MKVTRSNVLVSKERFLYNAPISKVSKPQHIGLKDIAQVKVFQTRSKFKIKVTK